jgi:hypothetical protein
MVKKMDLPVKIVDKGEGVTRQHSGIFSFL